MKDAFLTRVSIVIHTTRKSRHIFCLSILEPLPVEMYFEENGGIK